MKARKWTVGIAVSIFALFIAYIYYSDIALARHGILLNARTTGWSSTAGMSRNLDYEFFYKGEKIVGGNAFSSLSGVRDLEDRWFPVLYDTTLGTTQLLVRPVDFEAYDIPFPDSLKWVLTYMR